MYNTYVGTERELRRCDVERGGYKVADGDDEVTGNVIMRAEKKSNEYGNETEEMKMEKKAMRLSIM